MVDWLIDYFFHPVSCSAVKVVHDHRQGIVFYSESDKETAMTYIERMMCEDCIIGEMIFTGKVLNNGTKALFVHKCNKCGEIGVFSGIYPSKCERHEVTNDDDTD